MLTRWFARGCARSRSVAAFTLRIVVVWVATILLDGRTLHAQAPTPRRRVLVYACDGPPQWRQFTKGQLLPYVAAVDSSGRATSWFSDGAIFLALHARNGHPFAPWIPGAAAAGSDWEEYLDCLLGPGGAFDRLDSALTDGERTLQPRGAYRVAVMIPYPDSTIDVTRFAGAEYHLAARDGRLRMIDAYTQDVVRRFAARRGSQLTLDGMYWLHEDAYPRDSGLVHAVAQAVHGYGLRFLWIPYYGEAAGGWPRWRALGFDEAWLQPNYFFSRDLPATRIDSALARARSAGLGLEIEFNGRLLEDPAYADRLLPYLMALRTDSAAARGPIALFDGGGALLALAASRSPLYRALYQMLVQVMQ